MVKIGNIEIKEKLILAPMAGVTDGGFRAVCREQGAALTYTEMVSAKALVYQDAKSKTLLIRGPEEYPLAAQIFGSEPETMAEAAVKAQSISGCEIIDINMGCPTGKIVRNGDGCALMRDPELAGRIIRAVVDTSPVPVTVKIRKGWDNGNVNAVELAQIAEENGAAAVAVHGRTRSQLYAGNADWNIITAVKKAVNIPVIANGDIFEPTDAERILRVTGADLAMVGRGSMGNPWIFSRGLAAIKGEFIPGLPPLSQRCDIAVHQFEVSAAMKGEHVTCLEARKHYSWYLRGVPYASYFKAQIAKINTMDDIYRITRGIKEELK